MATQGLGGTARVTLSSSSRSNGTGTRAKCGRIGRLTISRASARGICRPGDRNGSSLQRRSRPITAHAADERQSANAAVDAAIPPPPDHTWTHLLALGLASAALVSRSERRLLCHSFPPLFQPMHSPARKRSCMDMLCSMQPHTDPQKGCMGTHTIDSTPFGHTRRLACSWPAPGAPLLPPLCPLLPAPPPLRTSRRPAAAAGCCGRCGAPPSSRRKRW